MTKLPTSLKTFRHSRGYLPHIDGLGLTQFVTFGLADSLPRTFLDDLKYKLDTNQISEIEYHRASERALDLGDGPVHLQIPEIAGLLKDTLLKFDGERYDLHAWVLMPNHGHILISPFDGFKLGSLIHSIKSFTANKANSILGSNGRFWSPDYFDRYIRNGDHFVRTKRYIEENPVRAHLCTTASEWPWSSASK